MSEQRSPLTYPIASLICVALGAALFFAVPFLNPRTGPAMTVSYTSDGQTVSFEIPESEFKPYIDEQREYDGLSDDTAWRAYLDENNMTEEEYESASVAKLAQTRTMEDVAVHEGIDVSDSAFSSFISEEHGTSLAEQEMEVSETTDAYVGHEDFIISEKQNFLRSQLSSWYNEQYSTNDADESLCSWVNLHAEEYNGTPFVKTIMLDPACTATADQIVSRARADFHSTQAEFTSGYSYDGLLNVTTDMVPTDTEIAIKALPVGEVSDAVYCEGQLLIIKVEDVYQVPEGGFANASEMPSIYHEALGTFVEGIIQDESFDSYMDDLLSSVTY